MLKTSDDANNLYKEFVKIENKMEEDLLIDERYIYMNILGNNYIRNLPKLRRQARLYSVLNQYLFLFIVGLDLLIILLILLTMPILFQTNVYNLSIFIIIN